MYAFLFVGAGGAIGAMARHAVNLLTARLAGTDFPWGTLAVNVTGSFLMGLLAGLFALAWSAPQDLRLFLTTGILGGFTTFSAFSLDISLLWERGESPHALAYAAGSVMLSVLALFSGLALGRGITS
ncbi:MAG TPA: fluoride efflux transporter CrcB [Alphaproteobacteria bacterium]|nr:fluoride efflux transporter CrcB [Alphaproteobacteria bacterium]